jgi:DNA-binding transcriptional MocR family regulator
MVVAEYLAHEAYDSHVRRLRTFFRDQLVRATAAIGQVFPSGTKVSRPTGGFLLWVELPVLSDTGWLAREAMNSHRIAIAPGCIFSASGRAFNHCLRLSFGHPWSDRIEGALRTLGHLARLNGRGQNEAGQNRL